MLDDALRYAARGWRVFPVRARSKRPMTPRGRNDATTEASQIREWWEMWPSAGIGLLAGNGIAVVDIDDEDGFDQFEATHGALPETLGATTGRGRHMFFRYEGVEVRTRIGIGRGVDLIAERGSVILPPSVHESGVVYAWDTESTTNDPIEPMAPLPGWIADLGTPPPEAAEVAPAGLADIERVREALGHIDPEPFDNWVRVGMALHHETGGSAEGEALWRAWSSSASNHDPDEQVRKWGTFRGTGDQRTISTVFHLAREAGHTVRRRAPDDGATAVPAGPALNDHVFQAGDEQDIANYLLERIEDSGPTVSDQGALWQYKPRGGTWDELDDARGRNIVGTLWGARRVSGVDENGEATTRHVPITGRVRRGVWEIIREERDRPGFFDEAPRALVFADLVVTLDRSGDLQFSDHHPRWRARVRYPFEFARALCTRWLEALGQWFEGDEDSDAKIAVLQEFAGACLFGLAPRYQRALILYGTGGNGKSTCLDAIEAMFPPEAVSHVAPHALMGNSAEYYLAELRGARLNVVRDMPSTSLLQSADFKAAVSGESLMGRRIAQQPFSFAPVAGHVFGANALPATTDQSRGFWRRWIVLPFVRRFQVAHGTEDLARDIVAEELPGMVAWAVQGAANLTTRGDYALPSSHMAAIGAWASNVNPVKAWLEDACTYGDDVWTKSATLYRHHREWCLENGVQSVSSRKFAERLAALGVVRSKRSGDRGFKAALIAIN